MSKLTKVSHKVFGILANFTYQMSKFGSFKNGSPEYAANVTEIQSTPNFENGLYDSLVGDGAPFAQDMNGVLHHTSRQVGYLYQAGIPEWDGETYYYLGSVCQTSEGIFRLNHTGPSINEIPSVGATGWDLVSFDDIPFSSDFLGTNDAGKLKALFKRLKTKISRTKARFFSHPFTFQAGAYRGAVYSPSQNRVYFVPYGQSLQTKWHYYDCKTGTLVEYTHGATVVADAYGGGVYDVSANRIIFIPEGQRTQANWHYIDCTTGNVVAYARGGSMEADTRFSGGIISPKTNRLYFVPSSVGVVSNWHYLNLSTMVLTSYANTVGAELETRSYSGGVYCPTQDRIYFSPLYQFSGLKWHFIDCATGAIVSYDRFAGISGGSTSAMTFIPSENKIYMLVPDTAYFYKIDCGVSVPVITQHASGSVKLAVGAFSGIAYSPISNRIYMAAGNAVDFTEYLDLETQTMGMVAFTGSTLPSSSTCVYSPTEGAIVMAPVSSNISYAVLVEEIGTLDNRGPSCCVYNKS